MDSSKKVFFVFNFLNKLFSSFLNTIFWQHTKWQLSAPPLLTPGYQFLIYSLFLFYFMNNYKTQRSTHVTNLLHFDLNKGIYSIIVTNKSDKKHVIYLLRPTQSYTFHVMLIAVWCGTKCSFFLTKFFRESRFLPTLNYYCRFSLFIFWYHHLFIDVLAFLLL